MLLTTTVRALHKPNTHMTATLQTGSAVRVAFFHFESNQIVIVGLKVTSSKYLFNKFICFYGIALLWFLL